MSIEQISLIITRPSGRRDLVPATIERKDGRILFLKSPFSLKDEIKAMKGARWHGYEEENPIKAWSVEERIVPRYDASSIDCLRSLRQAGHQVCLSEVRDRVRDGFQRL